MQARRFLPVIGACLLAACTGAQSGRPTAPALPEATTVPAQTQATPPPASASPAVREIVRAVPEPAPAPEALIGMPAEAVDNLLGAPDLVRRDGLAEVRLYRAESIQCTFHIFMYAANGAERESTVDHFEARNGGGRLAGDAATACYRTLVKLAATS